MKIKDDDALLGDFLAHHAEVESEWLLTDGAIVGEWRVTGRVGRGGSSEVYCARHIANGTAAAVKVLHRQDEPQKERFRREAAVLAELDDGGFPNVFGCGESDGRPYLAMELLEPLPLPTSDAAVARYLVAVARALSSLHAKGLVHRDVKPRNILRRSGTNAPVLVDLGLVKSVSGTADITLDPLSVVDGLSVGVGTPRFGAPEQFEGGALSPATDIHALGVLADDCFGGRAPRAWKSIIRRATSSIARERFQNVDEFVSAVKRRHWARKALVVAALAVFAAVAATIVHQRLPQTIPETVELKGRRLTFQKPVTLAANRTYRVIGPGTLDAALTGPASTTLWMTNCVVLNRAREIFPKVGLKYDLVDGVYLNFTDAERPRGNFRLSDFILPYDGKFNALKFKGPETREELNAADHAATMETLREDIRAIESASDTP